MDNIIVHNETEFKLFLDREGIALYFGYPEFTEEVMLIIKDGKVLFELELVSQCQSSIELVK